MGPDYQPPCVSLPAQFVEVSEAQLYYTEDSDLVEWWSRFHDPKLDQLLEEALDSNFDYKIALERIAQARAQFWTEWAMLLPEFDSSATATRFKTSESFVSSSTPLSPYQDFFQLGLAAVWELDLWGKFRRSADSARDLLEATEDDARGVKLVVLSEIASTYVKICAFHEQVINSDQVVASDQDLMRLMTAKFNAGLADQQQVLSAESTLAADLAANVVYKNGLIQSIYSLAVLVDKTPAELLGEFQEIAPTPEAMGQLPLTIPADLLRRRPDVRSAERQLASATEEIGVAVADLFPTVSLAGSSSSFAANPLQGSNVGLSSPKLGKLFDSKSLIWGAGGFVTFPVLDFGKRSSHVDVQVAFKNQIYWSYQQVVVKALQESEQAMAAYRHEAARMKELMKKTDNLKSTFELAHHLFKAGLADFSGVIQARQAWQESVQELILSRQALAQDLIAIYKAIGGEWL